MLVRDEDGWVPEAIDSPTRRQSARRDDAPPLRRGTHSTANAQAGGKETSSRFSAVELGTRKSSSLHSADQRSPQRDSIPPSSPVSGDTPTATRTSPDRATLDRPTPTTARDNASDGVVVNYDVWLRPE